MDYGYRRLCRLHTSNIKSTSCHKDGLCCVEHVNHCRDGGSGVALLVNGMYRSDVVARQNPQTATEIVGGCHRFCSPSPRKTEEKTGDVMGPGIRTSGLCTLSL